MIGKNELAEVSYIGNGDSNQFPIPFKTWNTDDLVVFVIRQDDGIRLDAALTADYSLSADRKELTLVNNAKEWLESGNLKTGYTLFIQFSSEAYQPHKFTDIGGITPTKVMESIDRLAMTSKAINDKASRALQFEAGAGNSQLPPLVGNAGRLLKVNDTEDGIDYGPDVQEVFDARDQAINAASNASGYATNASNSADSAALSASNANASALQAYNYKEAASISAGEALTSEQNAKAYEQEAERWAHYYAFEEMKTITEADSPYDVDYELDENFLIMIDTTDGDVTLNLPNLAVMPNPAWKLGIVKTSDDANTITVTPYPGQTIKNQSSLVLDKTNVGIVFHDATPYNWHGDVLIVGSFGGGAGSGLPPGGDVGDYLEKQSNVEGDAVWKSGAFSGYSAQFGRDITATDLRDMILKIVRFEYTAPAVTLSASGSGTVREKGSVVTAVSLTANVTKRTNPIARIRFRLNGSDIEDLNPPSNTGSGTHYYNWSGSFSDNVTFQVVVTDEATAEGGPTNVQASASFNFVYPYYYGADLPGRTGAQVASLTKDVIASTASVTRTITADAGDVFYFAYPKSYGALSSIKDINNFETLDSWTQREDTITGLDGNPVVYYVYEFDNVQVANTTSFTFIR